MTMYRQEAPSRLIKGTVSGVDNADSPNPRYRVVLRDTNHPVPMEIYAWASPDQYHQASAIQHTIGEEVDVVIIGGRASIVKSEPPGYPKTPLTTIEYEALRLLMGAFGLTVYTSEGQVHIGRDSFTAHHPLDDTTPAVVPTPRQNLVFESGRNLFLRGNDVQMRTVADGPTAGVPAFVVGHHGLDGAGEYRRVMVEGSAAPSLGAVTIQIPAEPNLSVSGSIRIPQGGMSQSFTGTLDLPGRSVTVNLSTILEWADRLAVGTDGLVGSAPAAGLTDAGLTLPIGSVAGPRDGPYALMLNVAVPQVAAGNTVIAIYECTLNAVGPENVDRLLSLVPTGDPMNPFATVQGSPLPPVQGFPLVPVAVVDAGSYPLRALASVMHTYILDDTNQAHFQAIHTVSNAPSSPYAGLVRLPAPATRTTVLDFAANQYLAADDRDNYVRIGPLTLIENTTARGRYTVDRDDLVLGLGVIRDAAGNITGLETIDTVYLRALRAVILDADTGIQISDYSPPLFTYAIIRFSRDLTSPYDRPLMMNIR